MTREEAIEILKDLWRYEHSIYLETDIRKALEMAIKALEQELCRDMKEIKEIHCNCTDAEITKSFIEAVKDLLPSAEKAESKPQERNCQFCDNYADGYCDVLDLQPSYPKNGCDYFKVSMPNIQEIYYKVKELSERVETLENQIIESKKEKIKKLEAELDYAKFRCALPTILNMMSDN